MILVWQQVDLVLRRGGGGSASCKLIFSLLTIACRGSCPFVFQSPSAILVACGRWGRGRNGRGKGDFYYD